MNARIVLTFAFALSASCGGGSSGSTRGAPLRFLYAAALGGPNTFPTNIYGFTVYSNGTLVPVPGSPAPTADYGGGPIAITRDSKLLYTTDASGEGLAAFQIHAQGSLSSAPASGFSMTDVQKGLVAHPTADFLYASGQSGVITVFAIDSATGGLSPTSSVSVGSQYIQNSAAVTRDGRYLYQDDRFPPPDAPPAMWQIAGFSADAVTGSLSPVPGSPLSGATQATSSPYSIAIDPSGSFLYAIYQFTVVNVGTDGGIAAYAIDAASGALTALPGSPFAVGAVPDSVAIDASGKFLIVGTFPRLGGPAGNCLAVLSIDADSGALTAVPGSPFGPMQSCGAIAADPSAPYVYAGSALENENSVATVSVLSIDQTSGALTVNGGTSIAGKLGVSAIALTH